METPHDHRVFTIDPADPLVEFRIQEALAACRLVAVTWCIADVKQVRPALTDDQAWEVLEQCKDQHDCEWGFTWTFIKDVADGLFGSAADAGEATAGQEGGQP